MTCWRVSRHQWTNHCLARITGDLSVSLGRPWPDVSRPGRGFLNLGSEVQVLSGTPFEIKDLIKNRRRGETSVETRDSGKADWSPDREREASARTRSGRRRHEREQKKV